MKKNIDTPELNFPSYPIIKRTDEQLTASIKEKRQKNPPLDLDNEELALVQKQMEEEREEIKNLYRKEY